MRKPRRLMAGLTTLPKSEAPAPTKDVNGKPIAKVNFNSRVLRAATPREYEPAPQGEPVPRVNATFRGLCPRCNTNTLEALPARDEWRCTECRMVGRGGIVITDPPVPPGPPRNPADVMAELAAQISARLGIPFDTMMLEGMRQALDEPVPLTALQAMEFGEAERRVMAHVAAGRTCAYRDDAPCEFDACRDQGCQVQALRRQGHSMHTALAVLRERQIDGSQEYHQVTEGEFRRILHQFVTSDPELQTQHRYEERPVVSYRWMGNEWGFLDARERDVRYFVSDDIEQILLSR